MAARLIRPLYVRYDVRTGKAEVRRSKGVSSNAAGAPRARPDPKNGTEQGPAPLPQPPKNLDDGSIKVVRDDKPGMQARAEQPLRPPATSLDDGSAKVDRAGRTGAEKFEDFCVPPTVKRSDGGSIKVVRDGRTGAKELLNPLHADDIKVLRDDWTADAPVPPPAKTSEHVAKLPRNDKIVIEELERDHKFRMATGLAKQVNRPEYSDDEYISTKTIIRIAAAVIVLGLAFAAILPSLLTRDPVESTAALITPSPPAPPARAEPPSVAQPVPDPRPAQAPEAPPPAAASNEATSAAKTAPVLRSSAPTDVPADGGATEVLLPSAGKAAGRTPLTAEEAAAVNRGLEALRKSAATKALPPRSAPNRPELTAEEKAAVERGLRELEKSGQTKQ